VLDISNLRTELFGPVSLSVNRGECVAIVGASGSGKSLLLRAIADLDPNEGEVRLGERQRDSMPAYEWRRLVALVPAESGWWSDHVGDHFEPQDDPAELLDAVGLAEALPWAVSRLSTGERQRLALVRALAGKKPLALLLDEPTASLDAAATEQVEQLLNRQRAGGVATLLVTHDRQQAERLASQRLLMQDGHLTEMVEAVP
jgi:ABC-type multidrug transport system ATPase subunit